MMFVLIIGVPRKIMVSRKQGKFPLKFFLNGTIAFLVEEIHILWISFSSPIIIIIINICLHLLVTLKAGLVYLVQGNTVQWLHNIITYTGTVTDIILTLINRSIFAIQ